VAAHQPLHPMQTADQAKGQQVMPHASGAIGPITDDETGTHLSLEHFFLLALLAAGSSHRGVVAATIVPPWRGVGLAVECH